MSYKLGIISKNTYLYVSACGRQTMDDNIKLALDCVAACKKYGLTRVLVDIRGLSGQPGVVADYELAKLLTAWETAKLVSHAALLEKEADLISGKFFETTARNRGINIYVFSNLKKAEDWITS
jgi:hypothetical protein